MLNSFKYALRGIRILVSTQRNARIHLLATVTVLALGFYLGFTPVEWCFILLAIGTVWTAEALNTSLETVVDLVSPEHHPLAAKAKDIAAGAVLISSITAAFIGLVVLTPYVF